ncbi:MAG: aldo/keto reductase [Spirochaetaceae bacterium]|nr:aldo/keto reductase [Spirochaetaceae bacterium]
MFGAAAFYNTNDTDEVMRTMAQVEEAGINHVDTAKSYGESERLLGPWMKHNRKKVFLATKTESRGYKEAKEDIQCSLELLQTDHVDLWQMHCLAEPEEWEKAKDEEKGAIRAFKEARDEGLVRFLGVTSHGMKAPSVLASALEYFPFDSVLVPYNYAIMKDKNYAEDFNRLSQLCREKNTAMQIIKTICKGPYKEGEQGKYNTWYEPLTQQEDIDIAVGWALNRDHCFINSAAEMTLLHKIAKAAQTGHRTISDDEMARAAKRIGMSNLFA